jgi:superfamily II DNA/RNA helicase
MPRQIQSLRARPRLIVGTPGRINDHLERGNLMLHDVGFLVLDETDRMLDMGFEAQIEKMFKYLPQKRQTMMFSATLPPNIVKMSEKYLVQPERISVGSTTTPITRIKQEILHLPQDQKYGTLLTQLNKREGSIIVFVKTKWSAERLADKLHRAGHDSDAIHGDLQQRARERVIDKFRNRDYRILVATDIAARGLDIPHIEHVINYDLPQCPEDYIHRIGRTARNGAEGEAVCLISSEDALKWSSIQRLINPGQAQTLREQNGSGKKRSRRRRGGKPFGFHNSAKPSIIQRAV